MNLWRGFGRAGAVALLLTLSGCFQTYPLGMSETQWKALTPQEQARAQARQAELPLDRRQTACQGDPDAAVPGQVLAGARLEGRQAAGLS